MQLNFGNNHSDSRSLWGVGWMSFFWSMASLMVFTLLPSFLTDELGANYKELGYIDAIAVALAFLAKILTGIASDYYRTRVPLITLGNITTAIIKPMFAIAGNIWWVFVAKSVDRLSKGVRTAPTDALIADITTSTKRGTGYGLRQTMYTLGAVAGALSASHLYRLFNNYRLVFWLSAIPAIAAVIIQKLLITEPQSLKIKERNWHLRDVRLLPTAFWQVLLVSFFLMLSRFSDAFLNLRAKEVGWSVAEIPLLFVGYELAHTCIAYPMGVLADRMDRRKLLALGIGVLTLTNLFFTTPISKNGALIGFVFCGLHMGMTQGLLSTLVSQYSPTHLRGTAFALYYSVTMISVFFGNLVAGYLGSYSQSSKGPFVGGFVWTSIALGILGYLIFKKKQQEN